MAILNRLFNNNKIGEKVENEQLEQYIETPKIESVKNTGLSEIISNLKTRPKEKNSLYENPILDRYYKDLTKQEKKLNKGKIINLSSPMSERYYLDGDIGQEDKTGSHAKTSGWSGLYTADQLQQAGIDLSDSGVDTSDIRSTAIKNIRYNPKTKNLYIMFVGGNKEYLFPNVPQESIRKFINAPSKGKFYNQRLKRYATSEEQAKELTKKYRGK